jgi:hypothetical protein
MLIKVRTLTGKEIELDIEPDYKVRLTTRFPHPSPAERLAPATIEAQFVDAD